jgi:molybdopterin-guanine dinucleotide biosynthesis protein A
MSHLARPAGHRSHRAGEEERPLGAVLAGGRGSRFGGAKQMVRLGGRPLLHYPLEALRTAGLECAVVAKSGAELPETTAPVVHEPELPRHPLCGIVAALRAVPGRDLVAVPCDMPFLTPALFELLAGAGEQLVVLTREGRVQPLPGRYAAALLPELEAALRREEPLRRTVVELSARALGEDELSRCGDPRRLLFNVNDREDLRRATALLGPQGPYPTLTAPEVG